MARVAIVTGGTRGIGEAISVALKGMGMQVAANYMGNEERAKAFTDRTVIPAYKWDVADHEACTDGVRQVESDLGPVDVLVTMPASSRHDMKRRPRQGAAGDRTNWAALNMANGFEGAARNDGRSSNRPINGQAGHTARSSTRAKSGIHGFTKPGAGRRARRSDGQRDRAGYIDTDRSPRTGSARQDIAKIPVTGSAKRKEIAAASLFGRRERRLARLDVSINGGQHMY